MSRNLAIAGIQMTVPRGEDNARPMLAKMKHVSLLFPWVDLIFFSELCLSGVDMAMALSNSDRELETFARFAGEEHKWVIPGSFYVKQGHQIYNTAVVISPKGEIVARYSKIFPWRPLETSQAGEDFCVFDIPGKGRFGLCICYDQWFPEVARTLAWMGAEAVFCPTATITPDREQEIIMCRSNAIANQLYWFSLNGLGAGGIGHSVFVDPEGRILQRTGASEQYMTEIIDLDLVSRVREYGTMGQCQVLKEFASYKGKFPVYEGRLSEAEIFKALGPVKRHQKIRD
jgi:predicted amidohydrolase